MKILVTGCCGFIGSHMTELLLKEGHEVVGIDNMNNYYDNKIKYTNLTILLRHSRFSFFKEDIRDTTIIDAHRPEIVCHLASMAGVRYSLVNPRLYYDVNVNGFINILQQCIRTKVKKVVYASSSSVYGLNKKVPFSEQDAITTCNSPYACTKLAMEQMARTYFQLYKLPSVGLRFFTVYGPRGRPDMAIDKFLRALHQGEQITKHGGGESFRDYTFVSDIVKGVYASINRQKNDCKVYNLGNSSPITLNDLIAECERTVGKKANILQVDDQPGDVPRTYADLYHASIDLKFSPSVKLSEGLKLTYADIVNRTL
jgi:UDP-glucuronate 4-epimerase